MILRLILHLEWHPGYGVTARLYRAPRPGDHATNQGVPGTLAPCPTCAAVGLLHVPDHPLPAAAPRHGQDCADPPPG